MTWINNNEFTMRHRKYIERRTFRQDRFEILIKRQKEGTATFNELTELDELVNRDPELREKVIRENILMEDPGVYIDDIPPASEGKADLPVGPLVKLNVWDKIKAFFGRLFLEKTTDLKKTGFKLGPGLMSFV